MAKTKGTPNLNGVSVTLKLNSTEVDMILAMLESNVFTVPLAEKVKTQRDHYAINERHRKTSKALAEKALEGSKPNG